MPYAEVPGEIYAAGRKFRQQVLAQEQQAAGEILRAYAEAWRELKARSETLLKTMNDARAAGKSMKSEWYIHRKRIRELENQIAARINDFAQLAGDRIRREQRDAIEAAADHAKQLTLKGLGGVGSEASVAATFHRVPSEALTHLVGTLQDGSPLQELLDGIGSDVAKNVGTVLRRGLALGDHPRLIAKAMTNEAGVGLTRALRISRTEVLRSYRSATLENYRANSHLIEGWVWLAFPSKRTCAMCLGLNGSWHPLDDAMNSHPNCRCTMLPKLRSATELGLDDIDEEPAESAIPDGNEWLRQHPELQAHILGKANVEAFGSGKLTLNDYIARKTSKKWGKQWVRRTDGQARDYAAKRAGQN